MKKFEIEIRGLTPLLMHQDDIEWADRLEAWKSDPNNKKTSKAGDDRSPAWRWIGGMYHDGKTVGIPGDNLMRCMMEGGALVPVPGAKGNKTFKAQTQSGMMVEGTHWPLLINGETLPYSQIEPLLQIDDFPKHKEAAAKLGFSLYVKRAKIGASKHIRVRPRFDSWGARGTVAVWDKQITQQVLANILTNSGQYKGLCDWRPGSRTPGSWGMFEATVREL